MDLAIVHYHLRPGGVSRVIGNHLRCLDSVLGSQARALILHGTGNGGLDQAALAQLHGLEVRFQEIPELAYDSHHNADAVAISQAIAQALDAAGMPADTIIHIHNHSLGKNAAFTQAVGLLADNGHPLLLQIHDFAEDFRPRQYRHLRRQFSNRSGWYPQAPHIHYAVLNRRDHDILARSGIDETRLHLLPNPVLLDRDQGRDIAAARTKLRRLAQLPENATYVLYPVRAIARKNVGEFLLHSLLDERSACHAISLSPQNPEESPLFQRWVALAKACQLPCRFDTGTLPNLGFIEHLDAADDILTCSVAEGFGMAFLESALGGHLVRGRDLPDITADFRAEGIRFPGLYRRLAIPLDYIGHDRWRDSLIELYDEVLASYDQKLPPNIEARCDRLIDAQDCIDFASLSAPLQADLIEKASHNSRCADQLRSLNPRPTLAHPESILDDLHDILKERYGLDAIGQRLRRCYERVRSSPRGDVQGLSDPQALINGFFALERFAPIRVAQ